MINSSAIKKENPIKSFEKFENKVQNDNNNQENIKQNDNNLINKNKANIISRELINKNIEHSKYYNSNIINLYQEHENIYFPLLPKFLKYEEAQVKAALELKNKNTNNSSLSKIIILIPITLPGSGKTELITYLQNTATKYGIYFDYISSDEIRKKEIEIYMKKMAGMTEREALIGVEIIIISLSKKKLKLNLKKYI